MKGKIQTHNSLNGFYTLWGTQSLSALGSKMTSFALVIWSYQQTGSAMKTALLSICSYAPYVLLSLFAGALIDRWDKKKTMLLCDSFAALTTLCVLALWQAGALQIWQIYLLNALNGLMNTLQQPASFVAVTLVTPRERTQRVSGLISLGDSVNTVLTPAVATAFLAFGGLRLVILFDLATCLVAVVALKFFIRLPKGANSGAKETILLAARGGIKYLRENQGVLLLILLLAAINLVASMNNAALPAMLLSRAGGGEGVLGLVNTFTGLATLLGSLAASAMPAPKRPVRLILNCLLFSMSTENLLLALGRTSAIWCLGAVLGWIAIPVMNANMDAILRKKIPVEMQGRVYSARNTLQFFTIPVGLLLGAFLVDNAFEPMMASLPDGCLLPSLLGAGKGSGAALLFLLLAVVGPMICLIFRRFRALRALEEG